MAYWHQRPLWVCNLSLLLCFIVFRVSASKPKVLFYEPFDEPFEGRWIVSEKNGYDGEWKQEKSKGHDDYGLVTSQKAKRYAIARQLTKPVKIKEASVVVFQFETRHQRGLDCGGSYVKFLGPQKPGWTPKEFDSESPYSIMFGPDKCGDKSINHFILKHKNPATGNFIEHHLRETSEAPSDNLTHIYTAILKPKEYELLILIDGQPMHKANLTSQYDFQPPIIPPETIPDPDDKKPEKWDDRAKIPDINAVKPDDWDEDAPAEIDDEDAVKPEGWLDDVTQEIDDPTARKPEEWDNGEDGEWVAPKIRNPKCETAPGCGEWRRGKKPNPAYRGKWSPPMIDNLNYMGVWVPRNLPNPEYFEAKSLNFEPVTAIGIEIWTMQEGLLFDNILIANDENLAKEYLERTWRPKFEAEMRDVQGEARVYGLKKTIGILLSLVVVFVSMLRRNLHGQKRATGEVKGESGLKDDKNEKKKLGRG